MSVSSKSPSSLNRLVSCVILGEIMRQRARMLRRSLAVCYPSRAICGSRSVTPPQRTSPAEPCHRLPLGEVPEGATFTWAGTLSVEFSLNHFLETSPLRNGGRFWQLAAREDLASRRRGFLLHTVTRFLRPQLAHYYGIICHLTSLRMSLESLLEATYRHILRFAFGRADAVRTMPGFPSYCAGSLLAIASSITSCRCPRIGRCILLHACPDRPPNQVRLRYGPPTSYRFLQTPPLADDALASRILFPVDGVRSLAVASDWVCQLRWANKKPGRVRPGSCRVQYT